MSDPEEIIKARIKPKIRAALETAAREMHPNGFRIDKDNFERLMEIITIERILPNDSCKPNSLPHAHRVCISVQADFQICVYLALPVKKGAALAGDVVTVAGATGGTAGGIAAGALIGSVVPGAGTLVGGLIGGIVGGIGGLFAGGNIAAESKAEEEEANDKHDVVRTTEVFKKLEEFSSDKNNNTCSCMVTAHMQCPGVVDKGNPPEDVVDKGNHPEDHQSDNDKTE